MTETKMAAIQRALKEDLKVLEEVKAAKSVKDFLAICRTHGRELTQAEPTKSRAERVPKLSDAELVSARALTRTCAAAPC